MTYIVDMGKVILQPKTLCRMKKFDYEILGCLAKIAI